jgi:FlaA1/EpsC-like NDP-sugar epimerase
MPAVGKEEEVERMSVVLKTILVTGGMGSLGK